MQAADGPLVSAILLSWRLVDLLGIASLLPIGRATLEVVLDVVAASTVVLRRLYDDVISLVDEALRVLADNRRRYELPYRKVQSYQIYPKYRFEYITLTLAIFKSQNGAFREVRGVLQSLKGLNELLLFHIFVENYALHLTAVLRFESKHFYLF